MTSSIDDSLDTLGPVDRLTDHLSREWWKELFDETYLVTDGDVLTEPITQREVDVFVQHASLQPSDHILDLCCGQGRHALELARRGFSQIRGMDQSEYLIDVAREVADQRDADVPFDLGDARSLPYEDGTFDVVLLLGNSFGYFDAPSDDEAVLREVRRVLRPEGRILLDLTDGDHTRKHFETRSWEWVSEDYLVCREREVSGSNRLVAREIVVHVRDGVETDQFYAERLYGRRDISFLLRHTGFTSVVFTPMSGESERGQDLGMMKHRFVVTALGAVGGDTTTQQNGGPVSKRQDSGETAESYAEGDGRAADTLLSLDRSYPQSALRWSLPRYVAVLLGDPVLQDETKRGGVFDEDDYEVVDELQKALKRLPGYEFVYFNDHSTLLDDLRTHGDAIDLALNLCDEGLRNQPRQELHIPALLDTLGIAYTGAGPQCLAHCYDKSMIRGVASALDIPVAGGYFLRSGAALPDPFPIQFPVIVKPNAADNSAGMTVDCIAHDRSDLTRAVESVRSYVGEGRALLIEEFLPGADLTYGLIGNPSSGFRELPISEDDYSRLPDNLPRFCGYEAKWEPDSPYWTDVDAVPASLPSATADQIRDHSRVLFERLECRDYARFDWRLDASGHPHLLEANPNPGWSWDSHLVEAAAFDGTEYPDVLAAILDAAYQRCGIGVLPAE